MPSRFTLALSVVWKLLLVWHGFWCVGLQTNRFASFASPSSTVHETQAYTHTHIQTLRHIDALHTQQSPIDNAMAVSFVCCYCALSRWQAVNDWKNLHYFLIVQGLSQLIATRLTGSMSDVKIVFRFSISLPIDWRWLLTQCWASAKQSSELCIAWWQIE